MTRQDQACCTFPNVCVVSQAFEINWKFQNYCNLLFFYHKVPFLLFLWTSESEYKKNIGSSLTTKTTKPV